MGSLSKDWLFPEISQLFLYGFLSLIPLLLMLPYACVYIYTQ